MTKKTTTPEPRIHILYGIADRDPNEPVLMFFPTDEDRVEFERDLPGKYKSVDLMGMSYDDILDVRPR